MSYMFYIAINDGNSGGKVVLFYHRRMTFTIKMALIIFTGSGD